jgi:hypothetical protein
MGEREYPMVWLVEKKVFYHMIDLGFESVNVPIRVKFEFEVKKGTLVPESLKIHTLYNKHVLEKRYPQLKSKELDHSIDRTVNERIHGYLFECGYIIE